MKKIISTMLAVVFILSLSACSGKNVSAPSNSAPTDLPVSVLPTDEPSIPDRPFAAGSVNVLQGTLKNCTFDPTLFAGKLQSCAYAGNGKLIVLADKMYLYDTMSGTIIADTDPPMDHFYVQQFKGGYLLAGFGDDGPMAYLFDDNLSLLQEIIPGDILANDFVVSETGFAISGDGKLLAITAMRGLYLYDLNSGTLDTLLDYTAGVSTSTIQLSMPTCLAFVQNNTKIFFCGDGVPVSGGDSFSIYGSVAVDGSNLELTKPSSYDIEELLCGGDRVFLPKTFQKSDGMLLWIDSAGRENTLAFATQREGKDGIYCSEQGRYAATAVLDGSLTVRIYDVDSGEVVSSEIIENADSTYFNRIPKIYILDDAKNAVVILGGSISEIKTFVSIIDFGE